MLFPNDVKVDNEGNVWVLSDKLPVFMYSTLDYSDVNFRIMSAKVSDAIKGTACASKLVKNPDIMQVIEDRLGVTDKSKGKTSNGLSLSGSAVGVAVIVMLSLLR